MKAPPLDVLHLARVDRFPEFRRPMEIDRAYTDPRHGRPGHVPPTLVVGADSVRLEDPTVPAEFGLRARAHMAILDYHRGDFELTAYRRAPWNVLKSDLRRLWLRLPFIDSVPSLGRVQQAVTDDGGTSRTMTAVSDQNLSGEVINQATTIDSAQALAKYGSNGGAVDGTEFNVRAQLGQTLGVDYTRDDTLFRVNASGSRIHTEANATIREVAHYQQYPEGAGVSTLRTLLVDLTVVADTPVTTNQTVALSWQYQF